MAMNSPEIPLKMGGEHTISWQTLMQTYVGLLINNGHWRPREGWTITKKKFLDILLVFRGLIYCWQKRGKWEPLVHIIVRFLLGFLLSESSPSRDSRHAGVEVVPSAQHPRLLTYWTCKGHKLCKINACFCDVKNTNNYITVSMFLAVHLLLSSVSNCIFCLLNCSWQET